MQKESIDALFNGEGFVYWEVLNSPDGTLHVLNGYSGGEKSSTLIEPRVISATTGATVFNLWHTYQNYQLQFGEADRAVLKIENTHNGKSRTVDLNFREGTFAFREEPSRLYALATVASKVSLH